MMRITNQYIVNSFLRVLNRNHEELTKTQTQVSTGKQFQRPSEGVHPSKSQRIGRSRRE
ncbi:hypothetical protein HYY75_07790 [bacterium]|nr:hypothetical protein [bacterium]